MNTFTKVFVGVSVSLLTTMSFAANKGNETSTYKIQAGQKCSGDGSGKGHWTFMAKSDGTGNKIMIHDQSTMKTTDSHFNLTTKTKLSYNASTKAWTGTTTVLKCKDLDDAKTKACQYLKLKQPMQLSKINSTLNAEHLGNVSYEEKLTVQGVQVTSDATFTFTK